MMHLKPLLLNLGVSTLLCSSIHSMQKAVPTNCSVEVFEVGQGNCTLIACDGCCPIVIDAGSSSSTYTGSTAATFKTTKIARISKRIREHAAKAKTPYLMILVSHADLDHYNWLETLMKQFAIGPIKIKKVVLGCVESLYPASFTKALGALQRSGALIIYPTLKGKTDRLQTVESAGGCVCEILPALPCASKTGNKNAASLVVKISYGSIACLVMGDADGTTTKHILASPEFIQPGHNHPLAKVKLLLASHHGSSKEECNNLGWIRSVKPTCTVISSGIRQDFHHPHATLVERLKRELVPKNPGFHRLYSQNDAQKRVSFQNGYGLQAVTEPLYGTLSQGTIVFKWSINDVALPLPSVSINPLADNKIDWPTEKECLLASLWKAPYTEVTWSYIIKLDLSGMALTDEELEAQGKGPMLDKLTNINSINLTNNNLKELKTLQLLRALYDRRKNQLTFFQALKNLFSLNEIADVFKRCEAVHKISTRAKKTVSPVQTFSPVQLPQKKVPSVQPVTVPKKPILLPFRPISQTVDPSKIFTAIKDGTSHEAEELINASSKGTLEAKDATSMTLLHMAAWYNNRSLIEVLIHKGVNVDATNSSGSTALHIATICKNQEAVVALLAAHAQVATQNNLEQTAFDIAMSQKNYGIAALLMRKLNN